MSFGAAQARLANLLHGGALITYSTDCYEQGMTSLARVGPLVPPPGVSKLVEAQFGELVLRGDSARLALRWHATRPGGGLFPALDADLELTALGQDTAMLRLEGAYRQPPGKAGGAQDPAALRRVAAATIQAFIRRVADAIVHPAGASVPGQEGVDPSPWQPPAPETPSAPAAP